jgi:hypothetical protein
VELNTASVSAAAGSETAVARWESPRHGPRRVTLSQPGAYIGTARERTPTGHDTRTAVNFFFLVSDYLLIRKHTHTCIRAYGVSLDSGWSMYILSQRIRSGTCICICISPKSSLRDGECIFGFQLSMHYLVVHRCMHWGCDWSILYAWKTTMGREKHEHSFHETMAPMHAGSLNLWHQYMTLFAWLISHD